MASRPPSSSGDALVAAAADTLRTTLPGRRWFGAKGRAIARVTPIDHAALPHTAGTLALFQVDFTDGPPGRYFVPLLDGQGTVGDALDDPACCAALVELMREEKVLRGGRGTFRFTPTPVLGEILPAPSRQVVRISGEQSNTSVIVGGRGILKVFRRLESGPNPDLEITEFLTRETEFPGIPRLAGSMLYEIGGEEPTTLGLLAEFVTNQGDAWTAIQVHLDEYLAAVVSGADGAPDPAFAQALAAADAREARNLGALTGRLHMALASAPAGSPLAPEPIVPADPAAWREAMEAQLDEAMAALTATLDTLPPATRGPARRVLEESARLRDGLAPVRTLTDEPVLKIRIHGDYHLGQVLRTPDGFVILDFEGEPARPLAVRRARQCALRDVAGMLRSYSYAARSGLVRALEGGHDEPRLGEQLGPAADAWEDGVRTAFVEGYLAETLDHGAPFLPRERDTLTAVLRAFELDKAVYELLYEIRNRPDWVHVPLHGLGRALEALAPETPVAVRPEPRRFAFTACVELRQFVGVRAEDERQLAELIDQVPAGSIHYHTHGFLFRHKFVAGAYPNDFATWVAVNVRDQMLGERLAMVDPAEFPSLDALREELVSVIDDHVRRLQIVPRVASAEPFDFVRASIVPVPTGLEVGPLEEFRQALLEVDPSAVYFHLVEARTRLGSGENDFSLWAERALGLPEMAQRLRALNPYTGSLERLRTRLIQLCDDVLARRPRP